MIGFGALTATAVGDQMKVVVTGSAINVASEDVLVPVPTVTSFISAGHIVSLSGSFDSAPGQAVVDFRPGQSRTMTFSATLSSADFKSSAIWAMDFNERTYLNEGGTMYASVESRAHSCVVRVNATPVVIVNTFGPVFYARVQSH